MIEIFKNIIRIIVLVLLQVLVFNRIEISEFLSPMLIVFFIIALPFNTPKWLLLFSSFVLGLSVDMFMNTPGILSFTAVLVAYLRPIFLQLIQPRDGYSVGDLPRVTDLGWSWYIQYSMVLTIIFHLSYFVILGFTQDNLLIMLWKTIISSAFTLFFILVFQIFSAKK